MAVTTGKEEMETPPTALQPAPTVQLPSAVQQQSGATIDHVELPPLFHRILQVYCTHDFDSHESLKGDFELSDGCCCKVGTNCLEWSSSRTPEVIYSLFPLHELYASHIHADTG